MKIYLDCFGKNKKHFTVEVPSISSSEKKNLVFLTWQSANSQCLAHLEKLLLADRLYITYDIGDPGYPKYRINRLFKTVGKLIVDNFSHCNDYYFICKDPRTFKDNELLDNINEFQFYKKFCQWQKPKKFIHPQLIKSDYQLYYGDLNIDYWIERSKKKLFNLPKKNFLFKRKLSCLVNTARYPRSMFVTLIYDLDALLSHRGELLDVFLDTSSTLDEDIRSRVIENYPLVKNKFSENQHWVSAKTYTKTATEQSFEMIQKSFCNIVIEDPVNSEYTRITEKILKPIVSYRPFLLLAAPNTLAWLKNNGFRTFDKWWDESYDQEPNHLLRIQAVYRISQYINSLSKKECRRILDEMQLILEHNQQHLFQFQSLLHKEIIS